MQRNRAIDCIKGIAIMLVMLGHCIVLNGLQASDPYLYDAIKSVQMPLFMAVSGALAGISFGAKRTSPSENEKLQHCRKRLRKEVEADFFKHLRKRSFHYLVPFFSWFILVYLCKHMLSKEFSFAGFIKELIDLLMQTDRGLWFLMTLFVVSLVVSLSQLLADSVCLSFAKKEKGRWSLFLLLTFAFYFLFFLQSRSSFSLLSPSLTLQYMPFFVLGYVSFGYLGPWILCAEESIQRGVIMGLKVCAVFSLVVFFVMVVLFDLTKPVDGIVTLFTQMLASFFGTFAIFALVYWMSSLSNPPKNRCVSFLSFVGQYTLEIYVLHFRFARFLGLSQKNLHLYSLSGILWIVAAFALMSVCTGICIFLIKKVRFLSLLLFGKA